MRVSGKFAEAFAAPGGRAARVARWACRICFSIVFAWNVQCALSFVVAPGAFAPAYQLSGVEGEVAIRGLGVAFLMWNATYPAFIVNPARFKALGAVALVQQVIGLAGELLIASSVPDVGFATLHASIMRFVAFDAAGLALMVASFMFLLVAERRLGRA